MATTPDPNPQLRDTATARAQADPSGQNMDHQCGALSPSTRPPGPQVMVPVVNDSDADDRAGWAGTVRPVSGAPGASTRGI